MPDPEYLGRSRAIHVEADTTDPSPVVLSPVDQDPVILGRSSMMRVIPEAPTWNLNESATGPVFAGPHYRGRSKAIHVRGERVVLTPPDPVPSCRCCNNGGEDEGGSSGATFDTFDRTTTAGFQSGSGTPSSGTEDYAQSGPTNASARSGGFDFESHCDGSIFRMFWDVANSGFVRFSYPPSGEPPLNSPALDLLDSGDTEWTARFRFPVAGQEFDEDDGFIGLDNTVLSLSIAIEGSGFSDFVFFAMISDPSWDGNFTNAGYISLDNGDFMNLADGETYGDANVHLPKNDWVPNVWYTVKVDWRISENRVRAKVWHDSESEPDWMLDGYGFAGFPFGSVQSVTVEMTGLIDWAGVIDEPQLGMDLDDLLKIAGEECRFEGFDQDVGDGWGPTWLETPGDAATSSVSDGTGKITVPFNDEDNLGTALPVLGAWEQTVRLNLLDVPGTDDYLEKLAFFYYSGGSGLGTGTLETSVALTVCSASESTGGTGRIQLGVSPDHVIDDTFASEAGWYLLKVRYDGENTLDMKVWKESDSEPDWMLTRDYTGAQLDFFEVDLANFDFDVSTTIEVEIDYIDFDYEGNPCDEGGPVSGDCDDPSGVECTTWDSFHRTGATWEDSDAGPTYSYLGVPGSAVGGTGNYLYTTGDVGVMRWEGGSPEVFFGPSLDSGDPGPWNADTVTFSCRMRTGNFTYNFDSGIASFRIRNGSRSIFINVFTGPVSEFSGPDIHGSIENDDDGVAYFDFHPLTFYRIKWRFDLPTGDSWVKIWDEDGDEPDWMVTNSTYGGAGGDDPPEYFRVAGSSLSSLWDSENPYLAVFDDFEFCGDDSSEPCESCEDPDNPGFDLPDFEPGYLPTFRKQIGDPTTSLDSFICTLESAAMVLAWHTRGAVDVWGGQLIPWCGKTEAQISGTGSNLGNAKQAWQHYGQVLSVRSGQTWSDLMVALSEGRAVILQGDYGVFTNAVKCQDNFEDNHAISLYPYQISGRILVGDPLCSTFHGVLESALQAYAEALGVAVFGVTSPQKILFAVSRAWVGI